jgi:N-acetylglucosaminyldiphosphoundecaprenol N-acetyl-beta-D-mannosaminyltransferase
MIEELDVLGVKVSAVNMEIVLGEIDRWRAQGVKGYATLTGVHGLMEARRDAAVGQAYAGADLSLPDGMPLVWLLWRAGFAQADRVYGPDLMLASLERSTDAGPRHYLYGSSPQTLSRLEANLRKRFPDARIVGTYSPPLRPVGAIEDRAVIDAINAARPDIIWVGLGAPKQDIWMERHRSLLDAAALIGVGAAFDFHAGLVRQAPRWIQRSGLEWAFRMAMEPRRLASRYLRNIPPFLGLLTLESLRLRRGRSS